MITCARANAEPRPDAPVEVWRSWIRDLIRGKQFTSRRWSWVCERELYFLKIPRVCGQLEADLSAGIAEAEREYRLTQHLSERLEGMVDQPLHLLDACIVNHRLRGPDLWRMAEREGRTAQVQAGISQGLVLAAKLHRLDPKEIPDLPVHDYLNDPHLPAPDAVNARLCRRTRVIVFGGLEVRNFKQASTDGQWRFFDPHDAVLGAPEDDFARYILSLLMIKWGRHATCQLWTRFTISSLYGCTRWPAVPLLIGGCSPICSSLTSREGATARVARRAGCHGSCGWRLGRTKSCFSVRSKSG